MLRGEVSIGSLVASLVASVVLVLWLPLHALADGAAGPLLDEDLDGDGHPERIAQAADGSLTVTGADGVEWGRIPSPVPVGRIGPPSLRVVHAGSHVFVYAQNVVRETVVREVTGPRGTPAHAAERVGLVDGKALRVVFSGTTGTEGIDAERSVVLRVDERGVLRYQRAPDVARCDGDDVLFPELYDVRSARFRAVSIGAPAPEAGVPTITATEELPAVAGRAPLGLFRYVAASSSKGDEGRADRLSPPRGLEDNQLDTTWTEGTVGSGRGAFVTARALVPGQTVAGIKFVGGTGNRVRSFAVHAGRWMHVVLDEPSEPGRAMWIPLPPDTRTDCVTVALDSVERVGAGDETSLAELEIYTALDGTTGALAGLVAAVEKHAAGSDAIAQIVAAHGDDAVAAVAQALPGTTGEGRRRLLSLLGATRSASAAPVLVAALATAGPDERALIGETLATDGAVGEGAVGPLIQMLRDRSVPAAARLEGIGVIGRRQHGARAAVLWPGLRDGDYAKETTLREAAIGALGEASVSDLLPRITADLKQPDAVRDGDAAVRVATTLYARSVAEHGDASARADLESTFVDVSTRAKAFALRFQLLRAARALRTALLWPFVQSALTDGDEVLRWAAVEAAAALPVDAVAALTNALGDADPRVRAAALDGLAMRSAPLLPPAATHALEEDRWPMVRRIAAERLAAACPAATSEALRRAISGSKSHKPDSDATVRRTALVSLAKCDPVHAIPMLLQLVPDSDAAPDMREQAGALIAALHPRGGAEALTRGLADVLTDGSADEQGAALAISLARALGRLGDRDGDAILVEAVKERALPSLRSAAYEALGALCTPDALAAFAASTADPDGNVRRAAERAHAHCVATPAPTRAPKR